MKKENEKRKSTSFNRCQLPTMTTIKTVDVVVVVVVVVAAANWTPDTILPVQLPVSQ